MRRTIDLLDRVSTSFGRYDYVSNQSGNKGWYSRFFHESMMDDCTHKEIRVFSSDSQKNVSFVTIDDAKMKECCTTHFCNHPI